MLRGKCNKCLPHSNRAHLCVQVNYSGGNQCPGHMSVTHRPSTGHFCLHNNTTGCIPALLLWSCQLLSDNPFYLELWGQIHLLSFLIPFAETNTEGLCCLLLHLTLLPELIPLLLISSPRKSLGRWLMPCQAPNKENRISQIPALRTRLEFCFRKVNVSISFLMSQAPRFQEQAMSIAGMTKEWLEGILFPRKARREIFSHCCCWEV